MKIATGIVGIVFSFIMAFVTLLTPMSSVHFAMGAYMTDYAIAILTLVASAFAFGLPIVSFVIMFCNWVFGIAMMEHFHGSAEIGLMLGFAFIPSLLMLINASIKRKAKEGDDWKTMKS